MLALAEDRTMMGNRGPLNGDQWDAFSRRSRPMLNWRPGRIRKIKRLFAKQVRQTAKAYVRNADDDTDQRS